ncbi:hypothetical protein GCM10022410_01440 [Amphibacillus indicireducens]|uniref:Uncharacterized protein n=1 Tax=Amphibacillus indicireducens TaxID=1076330 RepID=A0ABP7V3B8_9BACI
MSYLAILAAGIFFLLAAIISLFMFFKGFGKSYLLLTIVMLILVYFIFDLSGSAFNSLSLIVN